MLGDQGDREIAGDIARRQAAEGQDHEPRLQHRRRPAERHQRPIAAPARPQRDGRLDEREDKRENQRELPDFRRHGLYAPLRVLVRAAV